MVKKKKQNKKWKKILNLTSFFVESGMMCPFWRFKEEILLYSTESFFTLPWRLLQWRIRSIASEIAFFPQRLVALDIEQRFSITELIDKFIWTISCGTIAFFIFKLIYYNFLYVYIYIYILNYEKKIFIYFKWNKILYVI